MSLDFYLEKRMPTSVFESNITHNLTAMASAAGVYEVLWHPEKLPGDQPKEASEIIETLEAGLAKLKADPEHFRQFDAPNGWGKYDHFVPFVEGVLAACKEHPDAMIRTWT